MQICREPPDLKQNQNKNLPLLVIFLMSEVSPIGMLVKRRSYLGATFRLSATQHVARLLVEVSTASRAIPRYYFANLQPTLQIAWNLLAQCEETVTICASGIGDFTAPSERRNATTIVFFDTTAKKTHSILDVCDELKLAVEQHKDLPERIGCSNALLQGCVIVVGPSSTRRVIDSFEEVRSIWRDTMRCRVTYALQHVDSLRAKIISVAVPHYLDEVVEWVDCDSQYTKVQNMLTDPTHTNASRLSVALMKPPERPFADVSIASLMQSVLATDPTATLIAILCRTKIKVARFPVTVQCIVSPRVVGCCGHGEPCMGNSQFTLELSDGSGDYEVRHLPPCSRAEEFYPVIEAVHHMRRSDDDSEGSLEDAQPASPQLESTSCAPQPPAFAMDDTLCDEIDVRLRQWIDCGCPCPAALDSFAAPSRTPSPSVIRQHPASEYGGEYAADEASDEAPNGGNESEHTLTCRLSLLGCEFASVTITVPAAFPRLKMKLREAVLDVREVLPQNDHYSARLAATADGLPFVVSVVDDLPTYSHKLLHRLRAARCRSVVCRAASFGGCAEMDFAQHRIVFSPCIAPLLVARHKRQRGVLFVDLDRTIIDNSPQLGSLLGGHVLSYTTNTAMVRHERVFVRPQIVQFLRNLGQRHGWELHLVTKSSGSRARAAVTLLNNLAFDCPPANCDRLMEREPPAPLFATIVAAEGLLSMAPNGTSIMCVRKEQGRLLCECYADPPAGAICVSLDDCPADWIDEDMPHVVPVPPFNRKWSGDPEDLFTTQGSLNARLADTFAKCALASEAGIGELEASFEKHERRLSPTVEEGSEGEDAPACGGERLGSVAWGGVAQGFGSDDAEDVVIPS